MTTKKTSKKDSPIPVQMIVSIGGGYPIMMEFECEAHAKIAQAEMNDWYGRNYVRTKFIYLDG